MNDVMGEGVVFRTYLFQSILDKQLYSHGRHRRCSFRHHRIFTAADCYPVYTYLRITP